MSIADDYLTMVEAIDAAVELPAVQAIHIAEYSRSLENSNKFSAMVLADGTVGLTYTALDDVWKTLKDSSKTELLTGVTPLEAARLYGKDTLWERCLGMAAVNAISQFVLKQSGCALTPMDKTLDQLGLQDGDHVGMVGFFTALVEQVRTRGLPLTVVELDPEWLQSGEDFEVTLDPAQLRGCNKIVCTGTTLMNHSIDDVLGYCGGAEEVIVVGPTCGCLPDPLFERGVHALGGSRIPNRDAFLQRWSAQEEWRETIERYVLRRNGHYPGYRALLDRITREKPGA